MTIIRQEDLIQSVADAFQYISYYHPADYIRSLAKAYEREESPAARDAMAQILINSRMSAEGHRPICQDTGIAIAFVRVGMDVARDARDLLGAGGISVECCPVRHMLNLESVITYEGTESIHQLIVGRELSGVAAF